MLLILIKYNHELLKDVHINWCCNLSMFHISPAYETICIMDTAHLPIEMITDNKKTLQEIQSDKGE
jgi:hypothetical protein